MDSRGRGGEACTQRAFRAAGVGNGVAKSWQAQGIRGYVDASFERRFLGTQRQAASGLSRVRCCAVERSGRMWGWSSGVSRVWLVGRCAMGTGPWGLLLGVSRGWRCAVRRGRLVVGVADRAFVCAAPCHGDC